MRGPILPLVIAVLALIPAWARAQTPSAPTPIPSGLAGPAPYAYAHRGAPARAHPITGTGRIPQNPFLAPNGVSEIHDDEWQSDTHRWGGPLGRDPHTFSSPSGTEYLGTLGGIVALRDG